MSVQVSRQGSVHRRQISDSLEWMSKASCYLWRPLSDTWWYSMFRYGLWLHHYHQMLRGQRKVQETCLFSPPGTSSLRCAERGTRPASVTPMTKMTALWSAGSVAPRNKTNHPRLHYSRNLALRILWQSFAVGCSGGMGMDSAPCHV